MAVTTRSTVGIYATPQTGRYNSGIMTDNGTMIFERIHATAGATTLRTNKKL